METVFITAGLLLATLIVVANYMVKGIGGMAKPLRQVGLFLLNKAPAGLIDLFNDKAGSGTKTWMRFGMAWFFMAALSMFLGIWHRYDPTALNSLSSVGWSYDDGSMLTDYTAIFFSTALNYLLIGAALIAVSRSSNGRLASEASASMVAVLLTASTTVVLLLPAVFSHRCFEWRRSAGNNPEHLPAFGRSNASHCTSHQRLHHHWRTGTRRSVPYHMVPRSCFGCENREHVLGFLWRRCRFNSNSLVG